MQRSPKIAKSAAGMGFARTKVAQMLRSFCSLSHFLNILKIGEVRERSLL
jgi:hypothetical protein